MVTTLLVGGAIVTGLAVAVRMIKEGEDKLEHYNHMVKREMEIEREKDRLFFHQF